jgi:hypothetical protein
MLMLFILVSLLVSHPQATTSQTTSQTQTTNDRTLPTISHQFLNSTHNYGYFISITGNDYAMSQITKEMETYGFRIIDQRVSFKLFMSGVIGCVDAGTVGAVGWSVYTTEENTYNAIPIQRIVRNHICDWRWIDTPPAWIILGVIGVLVVVIFGLGIFYIIQCCTKRYIYQPINV